MKSPKDMTFKELSQEVTRLRSVNECTINDSNNRARKGRMKIRNLQNEKSHLKQEVRKLKRTVKLLEKSKKLWTQKTTLLRKSIDVCIEKYARMARKNSRREVTVVDVVSDFRRAKRWQK